MLYLIGLGLNADGISKYGLDVVKRCKRVYLENYTVDFPYSEGELRDVLGKKIISLNREEVESLKIIDEAKKMDISLLVYGSPLTATTHISLIEEAKKCKVGYKVIYNASILDAVAETGLQIYKFGKIASMPKWKENFTPSSFMKIVQENQSMKAHSLILIDIGLGLQEALEQLIISAKEHDINLRRIVLCQALGTKYKKIFYEDIEELKDYKIKSPYCIIIPSKLHFLEKEVLEEFNK
ncbi:MAG: diphthine synthase [Candidatus Pacearchaeota archaeon]|jgi:diphthine synthase|nr:diphthine synthase [Candidatus Pacearchaeota archaeon]|tara:strand:- start:16728 stop:17444 length:717 start_codon:yes stop_codon:yes gene_type:complete